MSYEAYLSCECFCVELQDQSIASKAKAIAVHLPRTDMPVIRGSPPPLH